MLALSAIPERAAYPGSLDPITLGHAASIARVAQNVKTLIVALGVNPDKRYVFSLCERELLARKALAHIPNVRVESFVGLFADYLFEQNIRHVVRGERDDNDHRENLIQDRFALSLPVGHDLTFAYDRAPPQESFISSSVVKAVLQEQGDASHLAPLSTIHALQARTRGQYLYGITGINGVGKTHIAGQLAQIARERGIPLHHIDVDDIVHDILGARPEPIYQDLRTQMGELFGKDIVNTDGSIDRKKLDQVLVSDPEKLASFNVLMFKPIQVRLSKTIKALKGVVLIDYEFLAESGMNRLVNNHAALVEAKPETIRKRRSEHRWLNDQSQHQAISDYTTLSKTEIISSDINGQRYGALQAITNDTDAPGDIATVFDTMMEQIDIYGEMRITAFFKKIGVPVPEKAYQTLRHLYGGDDRFYHALSHIVDGINHMPAIMPQIDDPDGFMLAWLFHDAVYVTQPSAKQLTQLSNEEQSADLMATLCRE